MSANAVIRQQPIRSALKKLHSKGIAALLPEKMIDPTSPRQRWKKPIVSRRIAKDLRKKAIREGTYGSYDADSGIGWDKSWDEGLWSNSSPLTGASTGKNVGQVNWMEFRGFKDTKRERTRESRAVRIEGLVAAADDKIADYRQKQRDSKPEGGVENRIKNIIKRSSK
mmetsp:Transcript_22271/g.32537  ORF Transcript_22271/g.32537 Transcript_22271/m.32537 type:complete len:168 (+) Transcript_22271:70-573(+)|eukprot:CAMPEP_0197247326 /NCGR_PEP_ID=MMETSP1429-20130617/28705_1 /TAXON_ID=49237 /ORGANISM="Chaetoceros  sp., Strain UNC1202" /LENGTH=167 /DNA_ID=CAMNT_0042708213 /DNA_START=61 /DNA_END=561 /DNA_ORIENTATION=+